MSDRIEGCEAAFGSSGYINFIPACMNGSWLVGCVQREVCKVWAEYGRRNVESAQSALVDVIGQNDGLAAIREKKSPEEFTTALHAMVDLALKIDRPLIEATTKE